MVPSGFYKIECYIALTKFKIYNSHSDKINRFALISKQYHFTEL